VVWPPVSPATLALAMAPVHTPLDRCVDQAATVPTPSVWAISCIAVTRRMLLRAPKRMLPLKLPSAVATSGLYVTVSALAMPTGGCCQPAPAKIEVGVSEREGSAG
jgi:hypothetical protein